MAAMCPHRDGRSVEHLRQVAWPRISQLVPSAELHVYGAYPQARRRCCCSSCSPLKRPRACFAETPHGQCDLA